MSLPPITESEVTVTMDLTTAIDPFATGVSSAISYRLSSLLPVSHPPPVIIPKEDRIQQFFDSTNTEPADEFVTPEYKEFLTKIDEFLVQFYKDNPYRMRIFLTADNENGTRYFLSSYIRPSVLPLIEAHTVELAAQFVANLCNYQILYDFFTQPRCMTTPNFTVKSQIGDCYDLSILLTTILSGIGYDASVMIGYADREMAYGDLRYRNCPGVAPPDEKPPEDNTPKNKYLLKVKDRVLNLTSKFENLQQNPPPPPPPPIEYPDPPVDEYKGRRLMAWVMVKSARVEIPNSIFVDASTGDQYPINSDLFGYVELAFNHMNVWINMQPKDHEKTEESMNFEDRDLWKPVIDNGLKIPSPVVQRLNIPDNLIFQRYPKGEKKLLWKDALEERYAAYTRPDGLVRRFFMFKLNLNEIYEIREQFASLRQRLIERRIYLKDEEMWERFEVGHPTAVISHKIKHGQWRLLEFEPGQRLDSLISRLEVFGQKIVEKFGPRDDGLCERKISIVPDSSTTTSTTFLYKGGPRVERMTQKYRHKSEVATHHTKTFAVEENFYKVYFDRVTDTMGVVYQHLPGRITQFSIEYRKDRDRDKEYIQEPSKYDPLPPEIDQWYMTETQNQLLAIREKGQNDSRKIAEEMVQWVQFRSEEESRPFMKMKSVDVVLHRKLFKEEESTDVMVEQPPPEPKAEGEGEDGNAQQQLSASDPLCVYFPTDGREINEVEAKAIQERAQTALINRLTEELSNLQTRLQQELVQLKKKTLEFEMDQHQSMSKKQGDEHQEYCNRKNFLITVLQKRIKRFPQTASRKIYDLLKSVKNHPKLSPFLGSTTMTPEEADAIVANIPNLPMMDQSKELDKSRTMKDTRTKKSIKR